MLRRQALHYQSGLSYLERLQHLPFPVLFDSQDNGRFDIVLASPLQTFITKGALTFIYDADQALVSTSAADPLLLLEAVLGPVAAHEDVPFAGGLAGFLGYGLAARFEPSLAGLGLESTQYECPDMAVGLYPAAIVVDHLEKKAELVARKSHCSDALWQAFQKWATATVLPLNPSAPVTMPPFKALTGKSDYQALFLKVKAHLTAGDCYQVNLSRCFEAKTALSGLSLYQHLRERNKAAFGGYLKIGGSEILSFTPEEFLRIDYPLVQTSPIKGTRKRHADPVEDKRGQAELLSSEKDRAENLMIVDLLRNDLNRICVKGSVEVTHICALQSLPKLHHLVSTIKARLPQGISPLQLMRAAFPGGSITGAPKIRVMEIIAALEAHQRGPYCGSLFYMGQDYHIESNILIRTLLKEGERLYAFAGGGVVHDSTFEAEYQEIETKLRSFVGGE